jgi:hypothetical protein
VGRSDGHPSAVRPGAGDALRGSRSGTPGPGAVCRFRSPQSWAGCSGRAALVEIRSGRAAVLDVARRIGELVESGRRIREVVYGTMRFDSEAIRLEREYGLTVTSGRSPRPA